MTGPLLGRYTGRARRRRWLLGWLVGSAISVVVVCAGHLGYLRSLDFAWLDALMAISPPGELAYPIKMVTADQDDFRAFELPEAPAVFPRQLLATVVRELASAEAGVICIDLLLDSPTDDDEHLEQALIAARDSGVPVVLACSGNGGEAGVWPLGRFDAHAAVGAVDVGLGPRGEVRTLEPWVRTPKGLVPSMAAAVREAARRRGLLSASDPPRGPVLVGFRPAQETFPRYAVRDVVRGHVPDSWLRGAVVIVGRVDGRAGDEQLASLPGEPGTSGGGLVAMPGVEVQANCVAALLSRRPPARTSMRADLAVGVLVAAIAAWLVEVCGVALGAAISVVVLLGGGVLASALAVGTSGYVVNFMPAVIGVLAYAQLYAWMARRRLARGLAATALGSLCAFCLLAGGGSWRVGGPAPTGWPLGRGAWVAGLLA
ncbi:MAG: CHASE2 domain-containing protein, partial [Armatimonadota bacterium]